MKPALVVLAAGASRRYGGLKQLDGVGPSGEALLDYAIYDALRSGFGSVLLAIRADLEPLFRAHLDARWSGAPIAFVHQTLDAFVPAAAKSVRRKPWGTAHAVLCAAGRVEGAFAVINADDFYGRAAYERAAACLASADADPPCALVAYTLDRTLSEHGGVSRAICRVDGEAVQSIEEMQDVRRVHGAIIGADGSGRQHVLSPDAPVSMNFWLLTRAAARLLEARFADFLEAHGDDADAEFRLSTELNGLLEQGRIRVRLLRTEGEWIGVTYAADRAAVARRIAERVEAGDYPRNVGFRATLRTTE